MKEMWKHHSRVVKRVAFFFSLNDEVAKETWETPLDTWKTLSERQPVLPDLKAALTGPHLQSNALFLSKCGTISHAFGCAARD